MSNKFVISAVLGIGLNLVGCASQPTKPPENVLNEIRTGNHGSALDASSFSGIQKQVVQEIQNQVQEKMVDPDSTKILKLQTKDFNKCIFSEIKSKTIVSANSPKGYCVAFGYNSKNRMGGYAGERISYAFVQYGKNGAINVIAPTSASQDSRDNSYPYTHETGVYVLLSYEGAE
ncbi:MAG: hypothetical protein Q7J38_12950 [Gallionella sp.]|nr:hypothetical protein [Gallionella sp.]